MCMLVCALYEAGRPIRARQRGVDIKKVCTPFTVCTFGFNRRRRMYASECVHTSHQYTYAAYV